MVRIKREEVARLRVLRGFRSEAALAKAAGISRQHVNLIMRNANTPGITLGTLDKLCKALSVPDEPCKIEDIVEHVLDAAE